MSKNVLDILKENKASKESNELISSVLDKDQEAVLKEELQQIWDEWDFSMEEGAPNYNSLYRKIVAQNEEMDHAMKRVCRQRPLLRVVRAAATVAAALFLPLFGAFAWLYTTKNSEPVSVATHEVVAVANARTMVTLSDGTTVRLSSGSKLVYPDRFTETERRVYLEGYGFFHVHSDVEHPFIVENPLAETKATGTKFSVYGYPDDNVFEAILVEGVISLKCGAKTVKLTPGMTARYNKSTSGWTFSHTSEDVENDWSDGRITFKDIPLEEVARKLSHWYGIKISIDPSIAQKPVSLSITNDSARDVVKAISKALKVSYNIISKGETSKDITISIYQ